MAVPKFIMKMAVKKAAKKLMSSINKQKMSKEAFGKLSVEAGQDNNPGITQADFVVNAEKKGLTRSSLTMMSDLKKHCYNSKKKK